MTENDISGKVLDLSIKIHKTLGPGLLEHVYEECLCYELDQEGFSYERQKPIPIKYKGIEIGDAYRADIVIENKVIVELKSVQKIEDVHHAQLTTYLRLSSLKLGLLINFGSHRIADGGFVRVVNGL